MALRAEEPWGPPTSNLSMAVTLPAPSVASDQKTGCRRVSIGSMPIGRHGQVASRDK
jgi:hypothetical protein